MRRVSFACATQQASHPVGCENSVLPANRLIQELDPNFGTPHVLYHSGAELVTDWPALFVRHGFTIVDRRDIITDTIATWDRVRAVYEQRRVEADRRYGHRLARRIRAQIDAIPEILAKYAMEVVWFW
jgi:hypothetical protein